MNGDDSRWLLEANKYESGVSERKLATEAKVGNGGGVDEAAFTLLSREVGGRVGSPVKSASIDTAVCETGLSLLEVVVDEIAVDVDGLEGLAPSFGLESLLLPNLVEAGRSLVFCLKELGRFAVDGGTASTD